MSTLLPYDLKCHFKIRITITHLTWLGIRPFTIHLGCFGSYYFEFYQPLRFIPKNKTSWRQLSFLFLGSRLVPFQWNILDFREILRRCLLTCRFMANAGQVRMEHFANNPSLPPISIWTSLFNSYKPLSPLFIFIHIYHTRCAQKITGKYHTSGACTPT